MIHPDNNDDSQHPAQAANARAMSDAILLHEGRHPDPFAVLGRHDHSERATVRAFIPGARQVGVVEVGLPLRRLADSDPFEWQGLAEGLPLHYRLAWTDASGRECMAHDPYSFAPQLSLYDLHLFNEGRHLHAYRVLGAHPRVIDGISGVRQGARETAGRFARHGGSGQNPRC